MMCYARPFLGRVGTPRVHCGELMAELVRKRAPDARDFFVVGGAVVHQAAVLIPFVATIRKRRRKPAQQMMPFVVSPS